EDGIRYDLVTGVQTCALPISWGFKSLLPHQNFRRRNLARSESTAVDDSRALSPIIPHRCGTCMDVEDSLVWSHRSGSMIRDCLRTVVSATNGEVSHKGSSLRLGSGMEGSPLLVQSGSGCESASEFLSVLGCSGVSESELATFKFLRDYLISPSLSASICGSVPRSKLQMSESTEARRGETRFLARVIEIE